MADVRKVIAFSAVDTGVAQMFDKMRRLSTQATQGVIDDAKKAGAALQQQWNTAQRQAAQQNAGTGRTTAQSSPAAARFNRGLTMASNFVGGSVWGNEFDNVPVDANGRPMGGSAAAAGSPLPQDNRWGNSLTRDAALRATRLRHRRGGRVPTGGPQPLGYDGSSAGGGGATLLHDGSERFNFGQDEANNNGSTTLDPTGQGNLHPRPKGAAKARFSSSIGADVRRESELEASGLFDQARKLSSDPKHQRAFLQGKVKESRTANRTRTDADLLEAQEERDNALAGDNVSKGDKKKINAAYRGKVNDIQAGAKQDELQLKLLQGIIDAIRSTGREEIIADRKNVEKQVGNADAGWFGRKVLGKKGWDDMSGEEEVKLRAQMEELGIEGKKDGRGGSGRAANKRGGGLVGAGLASQTSGALLSATGFAAFASIGGIIAKMIHEGGQLETNGGRMQGMTGVGYDNYNLRDDAQGYLGIGKSSDYGVKRADFMAYSTDLAQKRGYATAGYDSKGRKFNSGIEGETNRLMSTEIGFGLQSGYLSGLAKHQSYDTNNRETSGDVQNLIKIMGTKGGQFAGGDYSRLAELLETSNQLAEEQSGYLEQINSDKNVGVMASFSRLGGSFADQRMSQRIGTINGALRTPDNDFKQADAYAVLRRQNPNASFFELQEQQEKGLLAKGYMSGVMKDIAGRGGTDDFKRQMVKSRFGLSASQSRTVYDAYQKDNSAFDFESGIKGALGRGDIDTVGRARSVSAAIPIGLAKMDDMAAKAGDKTIKVLADMGKWVEEKIPTIVEGMKSMSDAASSAGKKLDEMGARADKVMKRVENLVHWGD